MPLFMVLDASTLFFLIVATRFHPALLAITLGALLTIPTAAPTDWMADHMLDCAWTILTSWPRISRLIARFAPALQTTITINTALEAFPADTHFPEGFATRVIRGSMSSKTPNAY